MGLGSPFVHIKKKRKELTRKAKVSQVFAVYVIALVVVVVYADDVKKHDSLNAGIEPLVTVTGLLKDAQALLKSCRVSCTCLVVYIAPVLPRH